MPERISDQLLAQAPITHDEHARALKELIHERVMQNRRTDANTRQDAALAKLAEENAKVEGNNFGGIVPPNESLVGYIDNEKSTPAAKPKAKKEK